MTDTAVKPSLLPETLRPYRYEWPTQAFETVAPWARSSDGRTWRRAMPEAKEALAADSRWPAFFPSPVCLVSTGSGDAVALEKVVGPSIVNRFPYVIALSFCKDELSARHYVRQRFMDTLEKSGVGAVQFLAPGPALDRAMASIQNVPDSETHERIRRSGLRARPAQTNGAPVFEDAYLVYEARLVQPSKDFTGEPIYDTPWVDVGSHRVYFLEINHLQLREDIARGRSQIVWRSLPAWQPDVDVLPAKVEIPAIPGVGYQKGYTPHYRFPSAGTIGFEADGFEHGMAQKALPALAADQVEVDNDRARWPCFFPSSVGMITTWNRDGRPNLMPCGSTTIVSRHPMVVAVAVSYAAINVRYAPRATLDLLRERGRFGCGVPYIDDRVIAAIRYAGNVSIAVDNDKVSRSGLTVDAHEWAPRLHGLPVHFDCEVIDQVRLGTHILFLGEVREIFVDARLTPVHALEWCPWAAVEPL